MIKKILISLRDFIHFSKSNFFTILGALFLLFLIPQSSFAFPIYAQQAYENPREANGRIVCANCHLAEQPTEYEAPSAVLPNSVFETVVKIPYERSKKQILGNGQKGGLNVGAVVILPEGFKLAPKKSP
jgi:apocytochrome f